MWKTVPHRLLFGRSFTPCWGTGGVAFLNPEINYNEKSHVCMYKITYVCHVYMSYIFEFRQGDILLALHASSNLHLFNRLEQFNDILFQENRLVLEDGKDGNVVYPDSPLIGSSDMKFMSTNKAIHLEPIKV
jgi:histone deacetylase 6